MFLGTMRTVLDADTRSFHQKMGGVHQELGSLRTNAGMTMRNIGSVAAGIGAVASLPLIMAARRAIEASSQAEEVRNKFDAVFTDIRAQATATANELAAAYGLSSTMAQRLVGDTGDLLTGFGFSQDAALDMGRRVTELGADLASFTNIQGGTARAVQILTSGMLGQTQALRSLGIAVLQTDIQKKLAEASSRGLTFATYAEARAYAVLELAMEQSKNAIGDYARTSRSLANMLRLLGIRKSELSEAFGDFLRRVLPVDDALASTIRFVEGLTQSLQNMSPVTQRIIQLLGGIFAGLVLFKVIIPLLIAGFTMLITKVAALTAGVAAMSLAPIAKIIVLLGGVVALIANAIGEGETFKERFIDAFGTVTEFIGRSVTRMKEWLSEFWETHRDTFERVKIVAMATFEIMMEALRVTVRNMITTLQWLPGAASTTFDWLRDYVFTFIRNMGRREFWINMWVGFVEAHVSAFRFVRSGFERMIEFIVDWGRRLWSWLRNLASRIINWAKAIWKGITDPQSAEREIMAGLGDQIGDALRSSVDAVKDWGHTITKDIKDYWTSAVEDLPDLELPELKLENFGRIRGMLEDMRRRLAAVGDTAGLKAVEKAESVMRDIEQAQEESRRNFQMGGALEQGSAEALRALAQAQFGGGRNPEKTQEEQLKVQERIREELEEQTSEMKHGGLVVVEHSFA